MKVEETCSGTATSANSGMPEFNRQDAKDAKWRRTRLNPRMKDSSRVVARHAVPLRILGSHLRFARHHHAAQRRKYWWSFSNSWRSSRLGVLTGLRFPSRVEIVSNFLEVFPGFFFFGWVAQQVSGMESGHDFHAVIVLKMPADFRYSLLEVQEISHRRVAQNDDNLWLNR